MRQSLDFFAVDIRKYHDDLLVRQRLIVVSRLVDRQTNAFVANRLPRAIQRAIGKELRLRLGPFTIIRLINRNAVVGRKSLFAM